MCGSCCCGSEEDDEQQVLHRSDERRPVVTQPHSRNYTYGTNNDHEVKKLRDEKEYLSQELQKCKLNMKGQDGRYHEDINVRELEIKKLKVDVLKLESKNSDLLTRLSVAASAKLTDENPNIADLSDVNRPTKLSEQFSELYDNEWTDAFEELNKADNGLKTDEEASDLLLKVLTTIFATCHTKAKCDLQAVTKALATFNGMDVQSKEILKMLKDYRKKYYSNVIKTLAKNIQDSLKGIITEKDASLINAFVEKCTSICWLMSIQDPPVYIDVHTDLHKVHFDTLKYKCYTQSGVVIDYLVWPVLYLHEGGNILSKGIAQGMKMDQTDAQCTGVEKSLAN